MSGKPTKNIIRVILLLGTVISLFYVPWVLIWTWIQPLPDTIQEQVNKGLDYGFEGTIVYVDKAGKKPAFYTNGWHERNEKIPTKPDALFKIASISKLYVAVAITKLVHDGELSLDKTLADYFPELVGRIENAEQITLRMMVQHRSGIPNFTSVTEYWANPKENNEERLALVLDQPANFAPDQGYEYSNTNYLLLAETMNKVLGYPYFQYVREEVLIPLNLHNTFQSLEEVTLNDVMSGYHVGYEPDLKTEKQGMLATAQDVGIFLRALNEGTFFNAEEKEIYSSIYVYNHTGLIPGYQSIAEYLPELDAVVVLFNSTTDFKGYHWNLSEIMHSRVVEILEKE